MKFLYYKIKFKLVKVKRDENEFLEKTEKINIIKNENFTSPLPDDKMKIFENIW